MGLPYHVSIFATVSPSLLLLYTLGLQPIARNGCAKMGGCLTCEGVEFALLRLGSRNRTRPVPAGAVRINQDVGHEDLVPLAASGILRYPLAKFRLPVVVLRHFREQLLQEFTALFVAKPEAMDLLISKLRGFFRV